jgi:Kef-type K+ transport system membrane component KefB
VLEGAAGARVAAPSQKGDSLLHVLLALVAILLICRFVSRIFVFLGQPPVIGEVVAGILLGPSFLGQISPEAASFLLPPAAAPFLGVIAQLGVILYMFLVGLELNTERIRAHAHSTLTISHASIVFPFLLGAFLSLWLYPRLSHAGVPFTSFALFMGVALAITAFPVLARILTDRRLDKTDLGILALSCAATNDVTAWCLLAFVVGVAQAELSHAVQTVVLAVGYLVFMFGVVRPIAQRALHSHQGHPLAPNLVAWVLLALLASALATEAIGIHAIFGAFLLGAVIPSESDVARAFTHKLEEVVTILLLPAFFAMTGMRTQIALVSGMEQWLMCGVIVVVATMGKFGGSLAAARWTGLDWRAAASVGVLMNTRGLMELIVLNIGLDLGVISPTLFAMMILMALVTTIATTPILHFLNPALAIEPASQ